MVAGSTCGELAASLVGCEDASRVELELYLGELESELEKVLKERLDLMASLRHMEEEMARVDGESAVLVREIQEMQSSLTDVENIIGRLQDRSSDTAIQADRARSAQNDRRQQQLALQLLEGDNRVSRLKGALVDLYAEQLVLKAGFIAFTGSLKGASRKVRITEEINEQTKQYIKDFPVLKAEIFEMRERISAFKTATAELTVSLRDKFEAERQQTYATAREHKYLCQLYEEEAAILDRLDADLKLQLDSATEVANKLTIEIQENETYFKSLQDRLQEALKRESKVSFIGKLARKRRKPAAAVIVKPTQQQKQSARDRVFGFWKKPCINCSVPANTRWCPACTVTQGVPREARDNIIKPKSECDQKRSAMKAQMKYLEHKIHQLEIEVYISKMNVEIQLLQTSLKIETWKKSGHVPATVQLSGILS